MNVRIKPTSRIFPTFFFAAGNFSLRFLINGRIIMPEIKKRTPANCRGMLYFNPTLIPTKAVAHSTQVTIARKVVDFIKCNDFNFFMPNV